MDLLGWRYTGQNTLTIFDTYWNKYNVKAADYEELDLKRTMITAINEDNAFQFINMR